MEKPRRANARRRGRIMSLNFAAVVGPVQQRLTLTAPAEQVAGFAMFLHLPHVAADRLPALDLPCGPHPACAGPCSSGNTTGTSRAGRRDRSSLYSSIPKEAGWRRRRRNYMLRSRPRGESLAPANQLFGKFAAAVGQVFAAEDTELEHLRGRQLRPELGIEVRPTAARRT